MSLKIDLPKWIFASSAKHFEDNISGITTFVEGTERDLSGKTDWIEIRIDGPNIREVSNDVLIVESEINLLVATHMAVDAPFKHVINIGKAAEAFTDFQIYKYGDDKSALEVFRLQPLEDLKEKIAITNMGQIDPNLKLLQATIEGHFRMIINN